MSPFVTSKMAHLRWEKKQRIDLSDDYRSSHLVIIWEFDAFPYSTYFYSLQGRKESEEILNSIIRKEGGEGAELEDDNRVPHSIIKFISFHILITITVKIIGSHLCYVLITTLNEVSEF